MSSIIKTLNAKNCVDGGEKIGSFKATGIQWKNDTIRHYRKVTCAKSKFSH